jgi:DNA-directed RNA polymerase specialized sigma24 family protein
VRAQIPLIEIRTMDVAKPDSNAKSCLFIILRNIWFNQLRQLRTVPEIAGLDLTGQD